MSSYIDKIIYINLSKRTDRREEIENELNNFNLYYERFEAIPTPECGIYGCGLSHLSVLKLAKERNYKNILILEDDFQFLVQWENQIVGAVNLRNISHTMKYGEIGYGVGEEFQGKGIGTESISQFVLKIFKETELRRLFAYVAEENFASRRILEKVGFVQEGICREHFIINGKPTNEVLYGILRSEVGNLI
jgi:ribosomal-protein-serine acetyltransferase